MRDMEFREAGASQVQLENEMWAKRPEGWTKQVLRLRAIVDGASLRMTEI
jgi:hypothetical protein